MIYDVHVITGQTATGKTAYALNQAEKNGADLISADARQVYRQLNIMTGKDVGKCVYEKIAEIPHPEGGHEKRGVVHQKKHAYISIGYYKLGNVRLWGCDFVPPDRYFSSFYYRYAVLYILRNTISVRHPPIVVGGSYFYLKHLLYGVSNIAEPDWKLRKQLEKLDTEELQEKLYAIDTSTFSSMNESDQKNPRRLIRKIEILANENQKNPRQLMRKDEILLRDNHRNPSDTSSDDIINILSFTGLRYSEKSTLEKAIHKRVEKRLSEGAVNEVTSLLKQGYTRDDPGLNTIGYTQIIEHLEGATSLPEAAERWERAEIQYAKRQYTFMKKDPNIVWQEV